MDPRMTGWAIGLAMIGMMAGLIGTEVTNLRDWAGATSPAFVGKAFVSFATVVGAFLGGKMIPTGKP